MKSIYLKGAVFLAILGLGFCATDQVTPPLTYYHGQTPQDAYFSVVEHSPQEIVFKIKVKFDRRYMYHLILDGNEPLAEGWFLTIVDAEASYKVKIKAKKGVVFEPGKVYRLCIGNQSTQDVARYRDAYPCLVDYEFVLPSVK